MSEENANPPPPPPPVSRKRTRKVAKANAADVVDALMSGTPSPATPDAPAPTEIPEAPQPVSESAPVWPAASENAIGTFVGDGEVESAPNATVTSVADLALESALQREQHLASDIVNVAVHGGSAASGFPSELNDEYPGEQDPTQDPPAFGELAQPGSSASLNLVEKSAETDEVEASADAPEAPVDPKELERTVEALLFAAMEPISVREIARAADSDSATIRKVIKALKETGDRERRPWDLVELAGAYRFVTRAEFHPAILRLKTQTSQRKLTQAALETLALIAYRQPIGRAEIESVRGVNAGPVLRLLLEKKLIQISGRGTGVGQPLLYATTDYFLENFGLKNVNELPKPGEFKNA